MTKDLSFKVSALVVLGITSAATSFYLSRPQTRAATTPRVGASRAASDREYVEITGKEMTNIAQQDHTRETDAVATVKTAISHIRATLVGDSITIEATATLTDKRPGNVYAWACQIIDSQGEPVASQVYEDQLFEVPPDSRVINPTFDEVVHLELPAWTYKVGVFVYNYRADRLLGGLNAGNFATDFDIKAIGAMGFDKITVN
jgi:hypothetical protein